jgi:hypothetical protein
VPAKATAKNKAGVNLRTLICEFSFPQIVPEHLLGSGCSVFLIRHSFFYFVADVLDFLADGITDFLAAGGREQKAGTHTDSDASNEKQHVANGVIFFAENSRPRIVGIICGSIRNPFDLVSGLVHDVRGRF